MEDDGHAPGDRVPACELRIVHLEHRQQLATSLVRDGFEHVEGAEQAPDRRDVRVGVVLQSARVGGRVLLVVLVGPHHPLDLEALGGVVVAGEARPEPGDLEDELGSVVLQEGAVVRRLVVAPGVVDDGGADVPLQVAVVGIPMAREGVQVQLLGRLAPIAGALPGEGRPHAAGLPRDGPRRVQSAMAVEERRLRDPGQALPVEGQDEELIPEDVTPVGFPVQAAGGDADVVSRGVHRGRLQHVEDVQPKDELVPRLPGGVALGLDLHVAAPPEVRPDRRVLGPQGLEVRGALDRQPRRDARLADGVVPGGVEGHHLLHAQGPSLVHLGEQLLGDAFGVLVEEDPPVHSRLVAGDPHPSSSGHRDLYVGLDRACRQEDALGRDRRSVEDLQVLARELPIARHTGVGDRAIDARADHHTPRPVLRRELPRERGEVRGAHVHQPAADDARHPPVPVAKAKGPGQHAVAEVELLGVLEHLRAPEVQP